MCVAPRPFVLKKGVDSLTRFYLNTQKTLYYKICGSPRRATIDVITCLPNVKYQTAKTFF